MDVKCWVGGKLILIVDLAGQFYCAFKSSTAGKVVSKICFAFLIQNSINSRLLVFKGHLVYAFRKQM